MLAHPIADDGATRRAGSLFGPMVGLALLAAAAFSPLALATVARPVRDASAAALAHAFRQAGLVCQVADWAAAPANPQCLGTGGSHAGWYRPIDPGEP